MMCSLRVLARKNDVFGSVTLSLGSSSLAHRASPIIMRACTCTKGSQSVAHILLIFPVP